MSAERNTFKLGATLLAVLVMFFLILLWLPHAGAGPKQTFRVRFAQSLPLPTLQDGSLVLVAGRPVGQVTGLALNDMPAPQSGAVFSTSDSGRELYLIVTAEIEAGIILKRDCTIRAIGEVLGGGGSLVIDVGRDAQPASLDALLEGSPPGGFSAYLESLGKELDGDNPSSLLCQVKMQLNPAEKASLMAKLHRSMDDLNTVTLSVNAQLNVEQKESLLARLHETMTNLNATTGALKDQLESSDPAALLGKTHAALDYLNAGLRTASLMLDENRAQVRSTVSSLESGAAKLDQRIIESIAQQMDPRNVDGLLSKADKAMDQLNASLVDIGVVTKTTRDVVTLNRENLNKMLLNFKQTSDHLKSAAKYVLRHPWRLLNPPTETQTKQQAIYDAARNFADAATQLDDAAAQLKALTELHNGQIPADDKDLERIRAELHKTFDHFSDAEKALWKELGVR